MCDLLQHESGRLGGRVGEYNVAAELIFSTGLFPFDLRVVLRYILKIR